MKRLLLLLVVLLFCAASASAQYVKVLGVAGRSTSVVTSGISSTNKAFVTYPLATIDIYAAGTTNHLSIFSNSTGTVKANPFSATTPDAYYDFFIAPGTAFDVRVSGVSGGVSISPFTRAGYTAPGTQGVSLALCGGTADTALLTALNSLGGMIEIPNTVTCASNSQTLTVPLQVDKGGRLKPITGQTITAQINNTGVYQIFTNALAGQGTVSFLNTPQIYPEWWTDNTTPGTTDMTTAIQAAIVAATSNMKVFIVPGVHKVTASLSLTGTSFLWIDGAGMNSIIQNVAPASNPTFLLNAKQYFRLSNFSIIGKLGFPNDAIKAINSTAFEVGPAFSNLNLFPDGSGIHLIGCNTLTIDHVNYWSSTINIGQNPVDTGVRLHGVLADGAGSVNDVHINALNATGVEHESLGGSSIMWNTVALSSGITITNCEIEEGDFPNQARAVDLRNVSSSVISGNFTDVADINILNSRYVAILANAGHSAWTIGDGSAPNACLDVVAYTQNGISYTVDSQSTGCGAVNSTFDTAPGYSNSGSMPITVNVRTTGSVLVPNQLGDGRLTSLSLVSLADSATAPTISSGFGTSPSVVVSNGTTAFTVNVGTGGTASSGTVLLPASTTGWICHVENITATNSNRANQRTVQVGTASDTTHVIVQNQTISTGAALAWTASDILIFQCRAY